MKDITIYIALTDVTGHLAIDGDVSLLAKLIGNMAGSATCCAHRMPMSEAVAKSANPDIEGSAE